MKENNIRLDDMHSGCDRNAFYRGLNCWAYSNFRSGHMFTESYLKVLDALFSDSDEEEIDYQ